MNTSRTDTRIPKGPMRLMYRVYKYVLPEVRSRLAEWRKQAERIPDSELRKQAIDSMSSKQFHCEGGSVYAAANLEYKDVLVEVIVAFQTISDYLDNLCDRSTSLDPRDFRQMHQSMLDAVDPAAPVSDYYMYHQEKDDGGYLLKLVTTCQSGLALLPSYKRVAPEVIELVGLYCDLQVYKHIRHDLREAELFKWWRLHHEKYPELGWNEFAAATGSTLGMFMLFVAAAERDIAAATINNIKKAYFPYICGLHILLDYLIDQEEDRKGGDLNFCFYYDSMETTVGRIAYFAKQARSHTRHLEYPRFHKMIIEGLLALYLSDPKVRSQKEVRQISRQLMRNSPMARVFFMFNTMFIRSTST